MSPKTTSEQRPNLWQALSEELAPYSHKTRDFLRYVICSYPRHCFIAMVIAMLVSAILAFTVFRHPKPAKVKKPVVHDSRPELLPVLHTAATLNYLWRLQGQVDGLLQKQHLDHTDSLILQQALAQMDSLRAQVHAAGKTITPTSKSATQP